MKVLAGSLGGRIFTQPPGIRPTSQLVREAIFNVLQGTLEGARVLELFAGSGALSFEALSRGAASAVLVERSRAVGTILRENVERLGLVERAALVLEPSEHYLTRPAEPFDLILLDPPYEFDSSILTGLAKWLTLDGVLVVEYAERTKQPTWEELDEISARRYGDTRVGFYRKRVGEAPR